MPQEIRTAVGRHVSSAAVDTVYEADMYLTDGVFLYRLVDLLETEAGEAADVEDCYGLGVVRVSMPALRARRLRAVTPAPSGG